MERHLEPGAPVAEHVAVIGGHDVVAVLSEEHDCSIDDIAQPGASE